MDLHDVIRRPLVTEKHMHLAEKYRQYAFEVQGSANKTEIKSAVEKLFDVKVSSVNTAIMTGKTKRRRQNWFRTPNWKKAVVNAAETDTIFLNRRHGPGLRALRTNRTEELEHATHNVMAEFGDRANVMKLYFGGDLEAAVALTGQVAGRIDGVRPVAEVIRETADECLAILEGLAERYPRSA